MQKYLFLNKEYVGAVRSLELYNEKIQFTIGKYTYLQRNVSFRIKTIFTKAETGYSIRLKIVNFLDKNKAYWYLALAYFKTRRHITQYQNHIENNCC